MLIRGSLSRMVPIALAVGDRRVRRGAEVDGEGFGRLGEAVALDRDRERLAGLAGRDGHVAGRGRVVAAGRGGDVRRGVVDRHIGWLEAAERVTVKVALTLPVLPSVTVTSLMLTDGRRRDGQEWSLISTETSPL